MSGQAPGYSRRMETSSPANQGSTSIFALPCPGCGAELVPQGPETYSCSQCTGRYRGASATSPPYKER